MLNGEVRRNEHCLIITHNQYETLVTKPQEKSLIDFFISVTSMRITSTHELEKNLHATVVAK